jgi:outer membrane biosynthesis protein TonB
VKTLRGQVVGNSDAVARSCWAKTSLELSMIRYAGLPVLAILAACSAEVENGEAAEVNTVEILSVNNLVVTDVNTVAADTVAERVSPPSQPAQTAAPAKRTQTTPEPKQQTVRKLATDAAPKAAVKPKPAPPAQPTSETGTSNTTCTAEHREMGHC